jgi:hypothetical protein
MTRFEGIAMSMRVAHWVPRLQAEQTHPRERLDAAVEPAADRGAHPGLRYEAAARRELNRQAGTTDSRPAGPLHAADGPHEHDVDMNRSERIGFWMYVAMGALCVAILVAAAVLAVVG